MFWPPDCPTGAKCVESCFNNKAAFQAAFLTSVRESLNFQTHDIRVLDVWREFDYDQPIEKFVTKGVDVIFDK